MKHLLYISTLLSALIIAACSGRSYRRSLVVADSLSCVNPQYSVRLLDSMRLEMSSAPKYERMYYNLLRIKAADKAYIEHKSDTAILPLIEYYEKQGDKKLLAEAYYYAGSVYRDMNDALRALDYFKKALDIMPGDADLRLKSNTCYQMGFLFLFQKLRGKAIESYKKAYYCDSLLRDTVSMIGSLMTIAVTYTCEKKMDSSLLCYDKAYNLSVMTNNKEKEYDVLGQMSDYYIEKGDYKKAKECLMPTLYVDTILVKKVPNYNMASNIYFNLHQYDSARYYCDELLKIGTVHAKRNAICLLMKMDAKEKKWGDMSRYIDLYNQFTDSINKITATQTVAQMDAMYNYQIREKENVLLKNENSRYFIRLILISSICCVGILLFIIFSIKVKQKRLRLELRIRTLQQIEKERMEQNRNFITENNKRIKELEKQLADACNKTEELTKTLVQQKNDLIFANEKAEREILRKNVIAEKLFDSDAHKIISCRFEQEKLPTKKDWDVIDISVNSIVENFKLRLYSLYHLSDHEYRMCLLIRLGYNATEIGILLSRSPSAITLARKRLYLKIFKKEGLGNELDEFVKSL